MQRCSTDKLVGVLLSVLLILATLPACKSQKHYDDSLGKDLLAAVSAKDVERTRSLLDRHANPNTLTEGGEPILFAVLLSMAFDVGEVVSGQISGDRQQAETSQIVRLLLDAGANPDAKDKRGHPVLMAAFVRGGPDIVSHLIRAGASVKGAASSDSALIVEAAYSGNLKIVQLMLDAGAGVNQSRKDGTTALLVATHKQKWDLTRYLIEKGADVNAHVSAGTALLFAAAAGNLEAVKLLVANGADVNAKDNQNISPLSIAQKRNFQQVVDFLKSAGAKP